MIIIIAWLVIIDQNDDHRGNQITIIRIVGYCHDVDDTHNDCNGYGYYGIDDSDKALMVWQLLHFYIHGILISPTVGCRL